MRQLPVEGDDDSPAQDYEGEFDFITENSDPELVQKVVKEFKTVDAEGKLASCWLILKQLVDSFTIFLSLR